MKRKKLWISLSVIVAILGIFVILCFTLFGLKKVTIDFRSSTLNLTGQEEQIIKSGKFNYGGSVIFMGKKGYIKRLERENPYLKVVNIETVFPSTLVIHATERLEVYAIEIDNGYIITDDEFKVLNRQEGEYQSDIDKPILYKGLEFSNPDAKEGEFLNVKQSIDIYSALVENQRQLHMQKSMIKSYQLEEIVDKEIGESQVCLRIILNDGQTYLIKNATYGLKYKIAKMMTVYSEIFEKIGQPIDKADESKGTWTEELLKSSVIEINNFYSPEYTEKDCCSKIVPPQSE